MIIVKKMMEWIEYSIFERVVDELQRIGIVNLNTTHITRSEFYNTPNIVVIMYWIDERFVPECYKPFIVDHPFEEWQQKQIAQDIAANHEAFNSEEYKQQQEQKIAWHKKQKLEQEERKKKHAKEQAEQDRKQAIEDLEQELKTKEEALTRLKETTS